MEWTDELETALFRAVCLFKPAGIHKYMHMLSITTFIETECGRPVSNKQVWERLGELYDLKQVEEIEEEALSIDEEGSDTHESEDRARRGRHRKVEPKVEPSEATPDVAHDDEAKGFELPWDDFGDIMLEHAQASGPSDDEANKDPSPLRPKRRDSHVATRARDIRTGRKERSKEPEPTDSEPDLPRRQSGRLARSVKPKSEQTAENPSKDAKKTPLRRKASPKKPEVAETPPPKRRRKK